MNNRWQVSQVMASQFRRFLLHFITSFSVTPLKYHFRSTISLPLKNRLLQWNPLNSTASIFSHTQIPRTIFTGNTDSKIQLGITSKEVSENPDDHSHLGTSKTEVGSLKNECRAAVANTLFDKEGFADEDKLILESIGKERKDLTTQSAFAGVVCTRQCTWRKKQEEIVRNTHHARSAIQEKEEIIEGLIATARIAIQKGESYQKQRTLLISRKEDVHKVSDRSFTWKIPSTCKRARGKIKNSVATHVEEMNNLF